MAYFLYTSIYAPLQLIKTALRTFSSRKDFLIACGKEIREHDRSRLDTPLQRHFVRQKCVHMPVGSVSSGAKWWSRQRGMCHHGLAMEVATALQGELTSSQRGTPRILIIHKASPECHPL